MGVVFVLGAGASYGESFNPVVPCCPNARPPLQTGFFRRQLYDSFRTDTAEYSREVAQQDYPSLFRYVRNRWFPPGSDDGRFEALSIEDVFTSIEIDREFHAPEAAEGARLLAARNELMRYIRRVLGLCTDNKRGQYNRLLVSHLHNYDSIISFNWDLLTDQALLENRGADFYVPFGNLVGARSRGFEPNNPNLETPLVGRRHVFLLKLHGSLNWFRCTNPVCPEGNSFELNGNLQCCLSHAEGIGERYCVFCGSEMLPLLIPPILSKRIADDPVIRAVWGLARRALEAANKIVVIGLSFAPTDFYVHWLFRSTVGCRLGSNDVIVVNPDLRRDAGDNDFRNRLNGIFVSGYRSDWCSFSEIGDVLNFVGRGQNSGAAQDSET